MIRKSCFLLRRQCLLDEKDSDPITPRLKQLNEGQPCAGAGAARSKIKDVKGDKSQRPTIKKIKVIHEERKSQQDLIELQYRG